MVQRVSRKSEYLKAYVEFELINIGHKELYNHYWRWWIMITENYTKKQKPIRWVYCNGNIASINIKRTGLTQYQSKRLKINMSQITSIFLTINVLVIHWCINSKSSLSFSYHFNISRKANSVTIVLPKPYVWIEFNSFLFSFFFYVLFFLVKRKLYQ